MSNISGTNVAAPVVPFTTDDTYPTHYALYGKGGWVSVPTLSDRDTFSVNRLEDGMVIYVVSEDKAYIRKGGTFEEYSTQVDFATSTDVSAGIAGNLVVTPLALSPVLDDKASVDYVDDQVATKASVDYVDDQVATKASVNYIDGLLVSKASVDYVDDQVATKASIEITDGLLSATIVMATNLITTQTILVQRFAFQ